MAKKQVAEKELEAKTAELQGADARLTEKETIESEADSVSIEQIKSSLATPDQDFDWDADDKVFGNYSDSDRKKFEDMYTDTFNQITQGEIISGIVVSINNKDVVLNVGFKSDGLVSTSEFSDTPDLKVGDSVDVFVEAPEDANGQLILSRKRAKTQRSWETINAALTMTQSSMVL
jgi:small subunit ribosomal protein S1